MSADIAEMDALSLNYWLSKFVMEVAKKSGQGNRPFPTCCEPHYESEAKCKTIHTKISFVFLCVKTNFHNKNFQLASLS